MGSLGADYAYLETVGLVTLMPAPRCCVPAGPVRGWLAGLELSEREIARRCAERAGTVESWRKWLGRLSAFDSVTVWNVDVLCAVFGVHVSRFDPSYWVAA